MDSRSLYRRLELDFNLKDMKDDWSFMSLDNDFIFPEFKSRYMGLVADNTEHIRKVYTATFPDKAVIDEIFRRNETDVLLFAHHAMGYIASDEGFPFHDIPLDYLKEMKKRRISFYMLHTPLDQYGEYSTSVSLAKALGLRIAEPFCRYDEHTQAGVICRTDMSSVLELQDLVSRTVGHDTKLYPYGEPSIKDGRVAIAAGGGSYPFVITELAQKDVHCYITGFTKPLPHFEPTLAFHRLARDHGVNVIGATHYSTEKFSCMAMTGYFAKAGVPAEFLEGTWYLEDL